MPIDIRKTGGDTPKLATFPPTSRVELITRGERLRRRRFRGAAARSLDIYAQARLALVQAQANRLACWLVRNGIQPDTLVGLCLDRSNHLVIAILAILKAGGAVAGVVVNDKNRRHCRKVGIAG